ncbi:nucleotidyl transferase AbiEii/AbiGii toxin family protein [Novosphingobium album (ex Liu et al. 2023)]|uniref:Nucleotidyl transferase AbiEii/AbiGii toxin family protein n=1 Tax=Novosphingobium album (ex Liu et al. 2023) TaxID=3031130 RepID=A0ABT5WR38_9SPHN|nr:nucleotidyl transferase AbiEii/AbiGii toxin family protein [Novosphingobium album (ex Liu et al. 2023)]MDE8652196.1 nucleotidyl transferase AbiEii/AbiGii toxin family protein [Novosphingobium album (ex Liu et al. 2023)]
MARSPANLAKSVKDRLLNISRSEGRAFDVLLVRFALERLLYRLSVSEYRERFVLKGGMLVTAWIDDDNRVTRDADFLGYGDANPDKLVADFRAIMQIEGDDGLVFDADALVARAIREEMEYGGVRLKTAAYLERTRIPVTIDIGFGDALADAAQQLDYPTLLDLPVPHIRSYPPATVIAEKFQAMVALGVLNGRMKDYYDLWAIPRNLEIASEDLDVAIRATFERRGTPIPTERPPGLSAEMMEEETKQLQWRAYAASIELEGLGLNSIIDAVWNLVGPSCKRLTAKTG